MDYEWNFFGLWQYRGILAQGLAYTVGFTILTILSGILVGAALALIRLSGNKVVTVPIMVAVELFRCTPVLVQLIWCYYALPMVIGFEVSPALAAFITLTLYGASFYAEIIRGGIASIELGQWDAGRALGMRRGLLMSKIIMPQAFRRMLPPLVNQSILQLKNTSLLSVVAVPDLLYQAQLVTASNYRPFETFTLVAILYFLLLFPLTRLAYTLEGKLR